jgi:hypothetical protein
MSDTQAPLRPRDYAANRLGYKSPDRVSALVRAGQLPAIRFGKRLFFLDSDLDAFIAQARFRVQS